MTHDSDDYQERYHEYILRMIKKERENETHKLQQSRDSGTSSSDQ